MWEEIQHFPVFTLSITRRTFFSSQKKLVEWTLSALLSLLHVFSFCMWLESRTLAGLVGAPNWLQYLSHILLFSLPEVYYTSTDCSLTQAWRVSALTPSFIAEKTSGPILALINWTLVLRFAGTAWKHIIIQIFMFLLLLCSYVLERDESILATPSYLQQKQFHNSSFQRFQIKFRPATVF